MELVLGRVLAALRCFWGARGLSWVPVGGLPGRLEALGHLERFIMEGARKLNAPKLWLITGRAQAILAALLACQMVFRSLVQHFCAMEGQEYLP